MSSRYPQRIDLISLIGGKDKFVSKLDALFVEQIQWSQV